MTSHLTLEHTTWRPYLNTIIHDGVKYLGKKRQRPHYLHKAAIVAIDRTIGAHLYQDRCLEVPHAWFRRKQLPVPYVVCDRKLATGAWTEDLDAIERYGWQWFHVDLDGQVHPKKWIPNVRIKRWVPAQDFLSSRLRVEIGEPVTSREQFLDFSGAFTRAEFGALNEWIDVWEKTLELLP